MVGGFFVLQRGGVKVKGLDSSSSQSQRGLRKARGRLSCTNDKNVSHAHSPHYNPNARAAVAYPFFTDEFREVRQVSG